MPVVLLATLTAQPGKGPVIREALDSLAPASRAEAGNLDYQVFHDPANPDVYRIFEVYVDDDAVTAHSESAHYEKWGKGVIGPVLVDRVREFYQLLPC